MTVLFAVFGFGRFFFLRFWMFYFFGFAVSNTLMPPSVTVPGDVNTASG